MLAAQNLSLKEPKMHSMAPRALIITLLSLWLAACGGSDGGTAPSVDPAIAAQLTAEFTVATNTLALTWKDVFPAGTNYRIQTRNADGSWSTLSLIAGTGGALSFYRVLTATTTLRVQAEQPNLASTLLKTGTGATEFTIIVGNPTLAFTTPRDGAFVRGSFVITGAVSSERAGALEVTATIGTAQSTVMSSNGSFSLTLDATPLSPGSYSLAVRAVDAQGAATTVRRNVVVASTAALTHVPLFVAGPGVALLASDSDTLLYSLTDAQTAARQYRLRSITSGNEITLANAGSVDYSTAWQLSGGRVYAQGRDSDCLQVCIYEWSPDGTRRNLSLADPVVGMSDQYPLARNGFVIWTNVGDGSIGSYTLFDAVARTYRRIAPATAATLVGNTNYDFFVRGGTIHFYYWATVAGSGMQSVFDVFRWTSADDLTQRVTDDAARSVYPASDGTDVIWQYSPVGQVDGYALRTRPVAGGTTTTIANGVQRWQLVDQTLAWRESSGSTPTVQARYQGVPVTLATGTNSELYGTRAGQVLYLDAGRTRVWSGATRTSALRVDVPIAAPVLGSDAFFFVQGSDGLVYRVTLIP